MTAGIIARLHWRDTVLRYMVPVPMQEVQEETQGFLAQMQRKEEEAEAKAAQLAETKRHLQELVERLQAAIIEEELSGPHVRMPAFHDNSSVAMKAWRQGGGRKGIRLRLRS